MGMTGGRWRKGELKGDIKLREYKGRVNTNGFVRKDSNQIDQRKAEQLDMREKFNQARVLSNGT